MWFRLNEKHLVNLAAFASMEITPVSATHSFVKALRNIDDSEGLPLTEAMPHAESHALFTRISAAISTLIPAGSTGNTGNVYSSSVPYVGSNVTPVLHGWHMDAGSGARTIEEFLTFPVGRRGEFSETPNQTRLPHGVAQMRILQTS